MPLIRTTDSVLINGKHVDKGALVEVNDEDAKVLIGIGRARMADAPEIAAAPKTQPQKMVAGKVRPTVVGSLD